MATIRELVTVLKFKLDKAGLTEYTRKAKDAAKGVERQLNANTVAQKRLTAAGKAYNATMQAAVVQLRRLAAAYIGIQGARTVLTAVDEQRQLAGQLQRTGLAGAQLEAVQRKLFDISQRHSKETNTLTQEFIKFRDALRETGTSTGQQLELFGALQASFEASGTSASRAEQLVRRFTRNLAEGALGTSTIQTFLDGNQAGLEALIKGLNQVAPELKANMRNIRDLAMQGKLTADIVLPALTSQLADLRNQAAKMPDSLSDATTRFRNSFREVIRGSKSAETGLDSLIRVIDFGTRNMGTIVPLAALSGAAWALGSVLGLGTKWRIVMVGVGLAAEDIYQWLTGGESILGNLVGPASRWAGELERAQAALRWIKDNIFRQPETPMGQWAAQTAGWTAALWVAAKALRSVLGLAAKLRNVLAAVAAGVAAAPGAVGAAAQKASAAARGPAGRALASGGRALGRGALTLGRWLATTPAGLGVILAATPSKLGDGTITGNPDFFKAGPPTASGTVTTINNNDNRTQTVNVTGTDLSNPPATGRAVGRAMDRMPLAEAAP